MRDDAAMRDHDNRPVYVPPWPVWAAMAAAFIGGVWANSALGLNPFGAIGMVPFAGIVALLAPQPGERRLDASARMRGVKPAVPWHTGRSRAEWEEARERAVRWIVIVLAAAGVESLARQLGISWPYLG